MAAVIDVNTGQSIGPNLPVGTTAQIADLEIAPDGSAAFAGVVINKERRVTVRWGSPLMAGNLMFCPVWHKQFLPALPAVERQDFYGVLELLRLHLERGPSFWRTKEEVQALSERYRDRGGLNACLNRLFLPFTTDPEAASELRDLLAEIREATAALWQQRAVPIAVDEVKEVTEFEGRNGGIRRN